MVESVTDVFAQTISYLYDENGVCPTKLTDRAVRLYSR